MRYSYVNILNTFYDTEIANIKIFMKINNHEILILFHFKI